MAITTRTTATTMSTNQTVPVQKTIKCVKEMDGHKYTFCDVCQSWKKKGYCNACNWRIYQYPRDRFCYDVPNNDRRQSKNLHRATQVMKLNQALNHAWICNMNTMLRYAQHHDGGSKLCIIVFGDTNLRHLILQIVHHMISDSHPPLAWP